MKIPTIFLSIIIFTLLPLFTNAQSGKVVYVVDFNYGLPSDTTTLCYKADRAFFTSRYGFNNHFIISVTDTTTKTKITDDSQMWVPTDIAFSKNAMVANHLYFGKTYRVKEPMNSIEWKIGNQTKSILGYTCQKATAHFRGRNYTAWFTHEIPVSYGPWKFNGLPGLILEVDEDTGNFSIKAQLVNTTYNGKVQRISPRGAISFEEYYSKMINYCITVSLPEINQKNSPYKVSIDRTVLTEIIEP